MKERLINWLRTKTKEDIIFVKKNPNLIFTKHPGMSKYDVEKLIIEPDNIITVEKSISHDDRLVVLKIYSKKYNTEYIILDPFYKNIKNKFKDKVAIVTMYPIRRKL